MSLKNPKRIHLLYGILTGAASILAGICLIAACLDIYYTGLAEGLSQIYTRQIVSAHFAKIAVPVYVCLVLVIGGMVLNMAMPLEKAKCKPEKNLPLILQRLQAKADLDNCEEALRNAITAQQKIRRMLTAMATALLALGTVCFLIYACHNGHWGGNSTPPMISAMYMLLGSLTIPFAFTVFAAYQSRKSMEQEIGLMRKVPTVAVQKSETPANHCPCHKRAWIAQVLMLAAGLALLVLGVCNQGTIDILNKAVAICTECVGLG